MAIMSLNEFIAIDEQVSMLVEGESPVFTDEQIEKAEYYDLKWNPVSGNTELRIFDVAGQPLATVEFEDPEIAIEFVQEVFELDEDDVHDLENYAWADGFDDRVYNALQDDGTDSE